MCTPHSNSSGLESVHGAFTSCRCSLGRFPCSVECSISHLCFPLSKPPRWRQLQRCLEGRSQWSISWGFRQCMSKTSMGVGKGGGFLSTAASSLPQLLLFFVRNMKTDLCCPPVEAHLMWLLASAEVQIPGCRQHPDQKGATGETYSAGEKRHSTCLVIKVKESVVVLEWIVLVWNGLTGHLASRILKSFLIWQHYQNWFFTHCHLCRIVPPLGDSREQLEQVPSPPSIPRTKRP